VGTRRATRAPDFEEASHGIHLIPLAAAIGYAFASLRVLNQYERGVTFFLGRYTTTKGPGLVWVPAGFARMKRVSLRIVALDVPPQDVITRDNISVR
jgi:regulator of protease activity HflC (stomatin/prohibitin superfamily)